MMRGQSFFHVRISNLSPTTMSRKGQPSGISRISPPTFTVARLWWVPKGKTARKRSTPDPSMCHWACGNNGLPVNGKLSRPASAIACKKMKGCRFVVLLSLAGMLWMLPRSLNAQELTGNPPNLAFIVNSLEKSEQENPALSRPYEVERQYKVFRGVDPKPYSEVTAQISFIPPDTKTFKITEKQGSGHGIKIVDTLLEQEVTSAKAGQTDDISRSNYDFVFVGEQKLGAVPEYVLHIIPKQRKKDLFLGDVWVDAKTYHIRQIIGVPVKSSSFWIKNIHITIQFAAVNGMWIPVSEHAIATVRFLGIVTLWGRDLAPPTAISSALDH